MNLGSYLIFSGILLLSFGRLNSETITEKTVSENTISCLNLSDQSNPFFKKVYFSKSDAEKILGEKAHLSDSSSIVKKDTLEIKMSYTADSKDQKTNKTRNIYFMIEKYSQKSSAKKAYTFFKTANEKHKGIKTIHNMGDEAYYQSDGKNFYFILVRKGDIMFRMKVNKITSHTSSSEFKAISKKISDSL